jgi:protein SCO1/2
MRIITAFGLGLVLFLAGSYEVSAHSLKSLENQLYNTEKYFQPLDKEAPDFTLRDADCRTVGSTDLRGKVVVLHFVYTNCPDVCPLHAERIAEVQEMINQTPMRDLVRFVTITTDPKNDTPLVMRTYGEVHGLDPVNWVFLTSGPERITATRELVERFGHKFTKVEDGYQVHGVVTHVIDMNGRWRANFHGLKFQPTNLVLFVNALTNDVHKVPEHQRSFWDRVRELF